MMIELTDRYLRLIRKLEKANSRYYKIAVVNDQYYIDVDTLLDALDDTEDNREYAEEKLEELNDELMSRPEEANSLQLTTMIEVKRLKEENDELRTKIEAIQCTLDEDDYDKLAMEGIEIWKTQ